MGFLRKQDQEKAEEIEKLKQQLIDLKQQAQEENKKLADQYTQQVKELEEKFQKKVREIGLIQLELKLIKEFCRKKAVMEKELEDLKERMETSNRRHQEVVVRLEKRFLEEKETNEGLVREKILQISQQKAQIGDLQHKVEKLEKALCHMTREFETETQRMQHQALIQNEAGMVEVKKLQQLLEMKDREMNQVKKLARNILDERTEVERFFLGALEHMKQEIIASRRHYKEKAQTAYYRKMMEACAGKEEFPKIKTFKSNINSTNSVYKDLEEAEKCYWEKIQFEKVDISELTWEQKERVLRLLFAKMNGTNLWKYSKDLAISAPAPADTREENRAGEC
uniref:Basal body-orientation factor 1 n=1 Tax=Apteryx owenii TaxID=8824 RepID=A0A8B9QBH2_APTOW